MGQVVKGIAEAPSLLTGQQQQSRVGGGFLTALAEIGKVGQTLMGHGDQVTAFEQRQLQAQQQERERQIKQLDDASKFVNEDIFNVKAAKPFQKLKQSISSQEPATAQIADVLYKAGETEKAIGLAQQGANRMNAEERRRDAARSGEINSLQKELPKRVSPEEAGMEAIRPLFAQPGLSKGDFMVKAAPLLKREKYDKKQIETFWRRYQEQSALVEQGVPGPISPLTPNLAVKEQQDLDQTLSSLQAELKTGNSSPERKQKIDAVIQGLRSTDPEERELALQVSKQLRK